MQPLVSALVPAWNAAGFLQATLDSLAAQTWPSLEILIADDASPDDTARLARSFAAARADTQVIVRQTNLGWLRNTNDLMARASGDYMFFAFHDDVVDPDYVSRLVEALRDDPTAVLAYSDMTVTEVDGTTRSLSFTAGVDSPWRVARGLAMAWSPDGWWVPNRGLFRRSAFERIGGIRPNGSGEYSADWTWLLHMALIGRLVRVPETLCHKYYTGGSISKKWSRDRSQQQALTRAGLREIRRARVDPLTTAVTGGVLLWRGWVPGRVRTAVRRLFRR